MLWDADWKDTDPWVMLQVPKGPVLEQHLLGPHVEGTITCHDYHSIYTQLQTIPITIGGTQYPVNIDSSKTVFNTVNYGLPEPYPQFSIYLEDAYGNVNNSGCKCKDTEYRINRSNNHRYESYHVGLSSGWQIISM